jgi:hypothetical protein
MLESGTRGGRAALFLSCLAFRCGSSALVVKEHVPVFALIEMIRDHEKGIPNLFLLLLIR